MPRITTLPSALACTPLAVLPLLWSMLLGVLGLGMDPFTWQELPTKHSVIHYQKPADLFTLDSRLDFNPMLISEGRYALSPDDSLEIRVSKKVDAIFERAQVLLDMRIAMEPVRIKLHADSAQLATSFRAVYPSGELPRSWYTYENHAVYVNLSDVYPGMLAHEIAHAVIDHYYQVRPPAGSAEILTVFVDKHLFD